MSQRIKALILAKKKYREYDELIWLYSAEYGLVSAIIRGVKRKRTKYRGELVLFSVVYVDLKVRDGLSTIYDFETITQEQEHALFLRYSYGAGMSELLRRVVAEKQPIQGMFGLLTTLFAFIPQIQYPALLLTYLQQKLVPYTGTRIVLESCVSCGATTGIVGYAYRYQGLLCANCQQQHQAMPCVTQEESKLLVSFFRLKVDDLLTVSFTEADLHFLSSFWHAFYEQNLGISLKSQKVLQSMEKVKEKM